MYAIIKVGGRQYRAVEGQYIDVNKLPYDEGESITIDDVLLVSNGDSTTVGTPLVDGASVTATIEQQFRGEKLIVYKYRQRTSYRRKQGHRQYHTRLRINSINA
ncbi:MAG: 50S ribosomal protein L21 [Chloroflexota bacterium]